MGGSWNPLDVGGVSTKDGELQDMNQWHMTKALWLHYENSNACMTKAEEVIAIEHREKEGNNKAIISYIYHSSHSNEVLCKTLTQP